MLVDGRDRVDRDRGQHVVHGDRRGRGVGQAEFVGDLHADGEHAVLADGAEVRGDAGGVVVLAIVVQVPGVAEAAAGAGMRTGRGAGRRQLHVAAFVGGVRTAGAGHRTAHRWRGEVLGRHRMQAIGHRVLAHAALREAGPQRAEVGAAVVDHVRGEDAVARVQERRRRPVDGAAHAIEHQLGGSVQAQPSADQIHRRCPDLAVAVRRVHPGAVVAVRVGMGVIGGTADAAVGVAGDVLAHRGVAPAQQRQRVAPALAERAGLVGAAAERARHQAVGNAVAVLVRDHVAVEAAVAVRTIRPDPQVHLHARGAAVGVGAEVGVVGAADRHRRVDVVIDAAEVDAIVRLGQHRVAVGAAQAEVVDLEVARSLVEAEAVQPVVHVVGVVKQLGDGGVAVGRDRRVPGRLRDVLEVGAVGQPAPGIGEAEVEGLVVGRDRLVVHAVVVGAVLVGVDVVARSRGRAGHDGQPAGEAGQLAGGIGIGMLAGEDPALLRVVVVALAGQRGAAFGVDQGLVPGLAAELDVGPPCQAQAAVALDEPHQLGAQRRRVTQSLGDGIFEVVLAPGKRA